MALTPGTKLGPYEILALIGAGGMGEVYRACDSRLDRTVAVKTLIHRRSADQDLRRRFEREARLISGLSHPHICTLFDIGREGETDYLVMEYLEGETLAHRLQRGSLAPDQTLQYGVQITDALEQAHRQGVIHRDLKPGNIMLTKSGAKLLDFGLAKMGVSAPSSVAATLTKLSGNEQGLTDSGVILGTFQYMAPEQLEGKEADGRTDIFALGTVLYEMATGECPFRGSSPASLIAAILSSEPPSIMTRQPMTPRMLDRVVKACLAKDPDERWQRAHDLKLELKWIAEEFSQPDRPESAVSRRKNRERLAWGAMAAALLTALLFAFGKFQQSQVPPAVMRFTVLPPEGYTLANEFPPALAPSPDGRKLVLLARDAEDRGTLWLRSLDSTVASKLPGTEGAAAAVWSSDSRFLLFVSEGKLKRLDTEGGIPDTLCDVKDLLVRSWNSNGTALLAASLKGSNFLRPIQQLTLDDCSLKPATKLDVAHYDFGHQWPSFLPDGKHFLYSGLTTNKKHDVLLGTLGSDVSEVLIHNASDAKYAAPEHLLFERNGYLFAQSFSLSKLRLAGESTQLVPQPLVFGALVGAASYDVSRNGILIYQERPKQANRLVVRDATGKQLEAEELGESTFSFQMRIAPDGRRLLIDKISSQTNTGDLWTLDLQRKSWERVSFEESTGAHMGVWSSSGKTIAYAAAEKGIYNLRRAVLDHSRDPEFLAKSAFDQVPTDWSRDGRFLLFNQFDVNEVNDLWVAPMESDQKPYALTQTRFDERDARFSPDSQHLVYASDETGRSEVYVNSFPALGEKVQISVGGGQAPEWSADGNKVYYLTLDWKLVEVALKNAPTTGVGVPHVKFSIPRDSRFEIMGDGSFLILERTETFQPNTVMLNWDTALSLKK
jgi:serine/threonine protein kinase/Tol biopolymer transport system component